MKAVRNSADLDATYHYYYDGDSMVEVRNGSDQVIKHYVWGVQYIDELVQVAVNSDPFEDDECDLERWALQDANWNVLEWGGGQLVERYEYTPYGERVVFRRAHWSEDLYAPTLSSRRPWTGLGQQLFGRSGTPFPYRPFPRSTSSTVVVNVLNDRAPTFGSSMLPWIWI